MSEISTGTLPDKKPDKKKVFVIYGRNSDALATVERFLDSLRLVPCSFEQIARDQGMQQHTSDIVLKGMKLAYGIIVLFTPDEFARLQVALQRETDDEIDRNRWQARPNVIFEAGMAYGIAPERTILTMVGRSTKLFSDVAAIPYIRLAENQKSREQFRDKLIGIGCDVDLRTTSWLEVNFSFSSGPDDARTIAPSEVLQSQVAPSKASVIRPDSDRDATLAIDVCAYIFNKQTGKVIDVTNWDRAAGVGIQQFDWHGGENQIWLLTRLGDDVVTIRSKYSGKYLTVPESSTPNGTQIIQSEYTASWSQQWKCSRLSDDGSFAFASRQTGLYLHVKDGSLNNNAPVVQKHWPQGDTQRWRLQLAAI